MNCNYRIVTDTAANIPSSMAAENNITVIPFSFYIEENENICLDTENFNGKNFYELMRSGKRITTSQIHPQRYIDYFEPILKAGEDILFIGLSSGVSGSFNSANAAKKQLEERYPQRKIVLIDSLGASLGEGLTVLKAVQNKANGSDIESNAELLRASVRRTCQIFTVDNLEYLHLGGRFAGAVAFLGKILRIKPLLKGNELGKIVSFGKTRSRAKILETFAQRYERFALSPEKQTVGISHADCREDAEMLALMIEQTKQPKDILIVDHEPVTGSYLGPGALALYFEGDDDVREK